MKPLQKMNNGALPNSWGTGILWGLSIFGISLIAYRFAFGLGSITNLSDGYPWGLWIGIDVLAGIALASGGFVMAGTVHLFGGKKFHPLVRPAIFTAWIKSAFSSILMPTTPVSHIMGMISSVLPQI